MIQKLLTKYWIPVHVAVLLLAAWGSALYPGTGWAVSLLWLSFFAVQAFFLLPTVLRGETLGEAQVRSRGSALRDPFVYVGLGLIGVACAQWLNSGCSLAYMHDVEVWHYSVPLVGWLPFSIEWFPAFAMLSLCVASVVGGVIFRNGTGKASKRWFLDAASAMSGCVAVYMVVQGARGVEPYSVWGASPGGCNWGTCFGFWLLVSLGGLLNFMEARFAQTLVWSAFSLLGNLLGVLQFETPVGIAFFAVAMVVLLGYWFFSLVRLPAQGVDRLKLMASLLLSVGLAVIAVVCIPLKELVQLKMEQLSDASYFETAADSRRFQSEIAWKVWQDHPWTGVGAGGGASYGKLMIGQEDWDRLEGYDGGLLNDGLHFLTEHGVIGCGFLVALVVVLLIPLFARLRFVLQHVIGRKKGPDWSFSDIDPYVISGMVAVFLVLSEGFFLSPFRSQAVFVSFVYVLAVIPGFLPVVAGDASKA